MAVRDRSACGAFWILRDVTPWFQNVNFLQHIQLHISSQKLSLFLHNGCEEKKRLRRFLKISDVTAWRQALISKCVLSQTYPVTHIITNVVTVFTQWLRERSACGAFSRLVTSLRDVTTWFQNFYFLQHIQLHISSQTLSLLLHNGCEGTKRLRRFWETSDVTAWRHDLILKF